MKSTTGFHFVGLVCERDITGRKEKKGRGRKEKVGRKEKGKTGQGCEEFGLSFPTHCARGWFHAPDNVGQVQRWMDLPLGRSQQSAFLAELDQGITSILYYLYCRMHTCQYVLSDRICKLLWLSG